MNFTFSHVVGIIGGALAAVAGLDPAVVAAVYPPAVPYAAAAIAAATALLALGHAVATKPKAPTASVVIPQGATATVVTKVVPALFAAVLVFGMTGCASLKSFFGSPTGNAVAIAAVDVAVATAEQKGVSPQDINRISKLALAADTGLAGTLTAISSLVNVEIAKLNLPPADVAAAQILEIALAAAISSKVGDNADLAFAQAQVAQVLNAAIAATGG